MMGLADNYENFEQNIAVSLKILEMEKPMKRHQEEL